ncbi:MAG: DUF1549 and DUF1553 domain-containing protein [Verrucomicrobiales bacterium]
MPLRPVIFIFWIFVFAFSGLYADNETPWSFQPLQAQELPKVKNTSWPKTRIDHFILARMEKEGLEPSSEADTRTLLRRLHFDLTGLPPSSDEIELFSPDKTSEKINELLASPHYGERWGRHWLDLARYTDTTASWLKSTSSAHLYRDWVVTALNEDMPYDQFVIRQLATDLLAETAPPDNAALGFLGLSPTYWKELQLPPEIIKTTVADEWEERVDALGRTFLGVTLACARCHDHKSDPITAADYYAIAGVFASVKLADRPTIPEDEWIPIAQARAEVAKLDEKQKALKKKKPAPEDLDNQIATLTKQIEAIKKGTPHYNVATVNGVKEAALFVKKKTDGKHGTLLDYKDDEAQDLAMHKRGDPNNLGDVVPRRFLSAFPTGTGKPRSLDSGSGRMDLALAIVNEGRPLSARVIVNRVWKHHFGQGIVGTPSEFGNAGEMPSHPELLDDLAYRFVENGWSMKWLHREILQSSTWQQSSLATSEKREADPEVKFYSYQKRRRLDVEIWRDAMLAATGELDRSLGGAPEDLESPEFLRRTIYGKIHRRDINKMLRLHDFPDPTAHSPSRPETQTPLQQLFTLNGPFVMNRAESLSKILATRSTSPKNQITQAYGSLFQRKPTPQEIDVGTQYLKQGLSLEHYAQVLLTSNEFLFID